jgi:prepilin-type N-terminal cleavage/methylation domain-containing protein
MNKACRKSRSAAGGFTLIELLVVIAVLAILATLVIGVGKYIYEDAARRQTQTYQDIIMGAIDVYQDETGAYPPEEGTGGTRPWAWSSEQGGRWLGYDSVWPHTCRSWGLMEALTSVPAAKAKLDSLPDDAFARWPIPKGQETGGGWKQLDNDDVYRTIFVDAYGQVIDYQRDGGLGGRPVVISAGPDTLFGYDHYENKQNVAENRQDNIRSDER